MDSNQKNIVLNILSSGFGMSKVCEVMKLHPKELSEIIYDDSDFLDKVKLAVQVGFTSLTNQINKYNKEEDFAKANQAKVLASKFVTAVALWESHCSKKSLTMHKAISALETFPNKSDAAISCGMELDEFIQFMNQPDLQETFTSYMNL